VSERMRAVSGRNSGTASPRVHSPSIRPASRGCNHVPSITPALLMSTCNGERAATKPLTNSRTCPGRETSRTCRCTLFKSAEINQSINQSIQRSNHHLMRASSGCCLCHVASPRQLISSGFRECVARWPALAKHARACACALPLRRSLAWLVGVARTRRRAAQQRYHHRRRRHRCRSYSYLSLPDSVRISF